MPHPTHRVRTGRTLAMEHFTAKRLTHHQNRCCDKSDGKHNDSAKNRPCSRAGAIDGPTHAESLGHEQARIFGRPVKNAQLPMIIIVDKHGIARLHSKEYARSALAIHHAYRNRCNHHRTHATSVAITAAPIPITPTIYSSKAIPMTIVNSTPPPTSTIEFARTNMP